MKKAGLAAALLCCAVSFNAAAQEKPARHTPGAMFQKLDLDADGRISKDEAQKAERKRLAEKFDAIDADKDGFLTKEELKAFRDAMKAERKPE